eukprot:Awhi_evm1s3354
MIFNNTHNASEISSINTGIHFNSAESLSDGNNDVAEKRYKGRPEKFEKKKQQKQQQKLQQKQQREHQKQQKEQPQYQEKQQQYQEKQQQYQEKQQQYQEKQQQYQEKQQQQNENEKGLEYIDDEWNEYRRSVALFLQSAKNEAKNETITAEVERVITEEKLDDKNAYDSTSDIEAYFQKVRECMNNAMDI